MSETGVYSGIRKQPYKAPKLTEFGQLTRLTQNGTQGVNENNGKGQCGTAFLKSGGASC